jgi:membrane-associated protease RseP (regulator of RpoE activity)
MNLLGWVIFIVALLTSVMLHESGHFVAAKRFGMKCTQYFVGFGPTLWSTQRGETEYGIKALPLGGFVKIVGMTSIDEVAPEDEPRSFRRHPAWQRLIVLAAGSFMHFVIAFVLLFGLALGIGAQNDNTTVLGTVTTCVPASNAALNSGAACTKSDPKAPAELAGLKVGDKVVSYGGKPVSTWTQLGDAIRNSKSGTAATIVVIRDGKQLTLHVTPATVKGRTGSYLGVAATTLFTRASPLGAVTNAGSQFWQVLDGSAKAAGSIPKAIPKLFSKDRGSTAGGQVVGVVGVGNITGQVVAANIGWQVKVTYVLLIIASLNIFVGAFNLLPLLPLDGGHIAVVLYERVRAWFARLRGRADPGLVDMTKLVPVSLGVIVIFVFFTAALILADIVNPVGIGQ